MKGLLCFEVYYGIASSNREMIWATFRAAAESLEAAVRNFLNETLGTQGLAFRGCVLVVGGALPRRPKTPYANEERLRLFLVLTGFRI